MSVDDRVLAVIESLYDAALDETRWADALRQLAELTDSQAATFWVLDGSKQPRLPTFTYINLEPAFVQEYLDEMAPIDPTVQYLVRHPREPIVHDGLVITERDKNHHPYYDWQRRFTDLRFRMVGRACPAPDVQAGVALHRTCKTGRYEPKDIEQFVVLQRHLERALMLGFRLGTLGTLQQCTTDLLDRNPSAILFVDEHKRIVYANQRASALHAAHDGITLTDGIALAHRQDNDRFQRLMARTIAGVEPGDAGDAMQAQRPSGRRAYTILVSPVSGRYPLLSALRPVACVIVIDPAARRSLSLRRLQEVFGLTEAEGRLAASLATGMDLRSAAEQLGTTYGTARVCLAKIFQKTDTRRQGELIALLLTTVSAA